MQNETVKCPCCGQPTPAAGSVRVNLQENLLYFKDQTVVLTPRLAELAFLLARRMPETVLHETLIEGMFGATEPHAAFNSVKVAIHHLRAEIEPLGLAIHNTFDKGYRLEAVVKKSKTERTLTGRAVNWRRASRWGAMHVMENIDAQA